MTVDETSIRQWADRHECRRNLPVLVRRLIRETTPCLSSLRFPGNDAVDLPGLDGESENQSATTWVPEGRCTWEMGCNQDPRRKAEGDYEKRTNETPQEIRKASSFVFVTPRRWSAKNAWLAERRRDESWKSVHAYDAIDLETWLEGAPATSRWLGELLRVAFPGLITPHEWWERWATACAPPISMKLVSTRRHNEQDILVSKLRDREQVVTVQADDREEAVAFVVASLIEVDALDLLDRTLVVTSGGIKIPASSTHLIVIADIEEDEEPDFGDRRGITIIRPYPKGRLDVQESISLSHVPSKVFRSELEAMGLPCDEAESRALQTGHSVPILRRQLSSDPEVRRPPWARDRASAKLLLPFALTGSWVEREGKDDEAVLQLLGELEDGEVERIRDDMLALDDAPIARYGNVNIVVSQLDALFAVGPYIEREDLTRFFQLVPEILGDRDPALDLPQDQWWMASVLGKAHSYSGALLSGLGEALCILAVHGAEICGKRLGIDVADHAGNVVRALMQDADDEQWLTIRGHLRALAEASPSSFLDCLDEELRKPEPPIAAIMGTTGGAVSGECLRTNLLWALEMLAWHPAYFSRVAEIALGLRRLEVDDNWSNSPKSTAKSLFLVWLPATSLSVADRMIVLRELSERFRGPVVDICISLLPGGGPGFASRTARPRWRESEVEVPLPTNGEIRQAAIEASRLLLDLAPYHGVELKALIEVATRLHPDDLSRLVSEVERWSEVADDEDKAELRHDLRRHDVMRAYQENDDDTELVTALRKMEAALEPENTISRHKWLFEEYYVEWRTLVEHESEGHLSLQERHAIVEERRRKAISEIQKQLGDNAVFPFALSVNHPELVAQVLVPQNAPPVTAVAWARAALQETPSAASSTFLRQVLWNAGWNDLNAVSNALSNQGLLDSAEARERFAEHLPGRPVGWEVAEALGDDVASTYWTSVSVHIWEDTEPNDVEHAIEKLLEVQRPRSAFSAMELAHDRLPPELWVRILKAVARGEEPDGPFPRAYNLNEVLQYLDGSDEVPDEQIANLELPFIPMLCSYGHRQHDRTLAIHRELARDPALFVQLLSWRYTRRDGTAEPEQEDTSPEHREFLAELACHTLEGWCEIPGQREDGEIDREEFTAWAADALHRAGELDRKGVAETHLGALLARFARRRAWDDWLPECVLAFLDRAENGGLREKFDLGVRNSRGVTSRGPYDGGEQERQLAGHYRDISARYENSYPRVAAMLVSIAQGYERDGRRQDERAAVVERWHP